MASTRLATPGQKIRTLGASSGGFLFLGGIEDGKEKDRIEKTR